MSARLKKSTYMESISKCLKTSSIAAEELQPVPANLAQAQFLS
jgi:hypothetical protein